LPPGARFLGLALSGAPEKAYSLFRLLERAPLFLRNHASIETFSGSSGVRFLNHMMF
jgi:hypothetical protein